MNIDISKSGWILARELVLSALLVTIFSAGYLHNVGSGYGADENDVCMPLDVGATAVEIANQDSACERALPTWALAIFVGIGVFLTVRIVSIMFKSLAEGNPLVTSVRLGYDASQGGWSLPSAQHWLNYFASIAGQIVGAGASALAVWLFAGRQIKQIHNVYYNGSAPYASGAQKDRALVAETIAGFVLICLAATAIVGSTHRVAGSARERVCSSVYSRILGSFYFVYMLCFWTHTRFTVDAIRGGWLCVTALYDSSSANCSTYSASSSIPLVVILVLIHVGLAIVGAIVGGVARAMEKQYTKAS